MYPRLALLMRLVLGYQVLNCVPPCGPSCPQSSVVIVVLFLTKNRTQVRRSPRNLSMSEHTRRLSIFKIFSNDVKLLVCWGFLGRGEGEEAREGGGVVFCQSFSTSGFFPSRDGGCPP